MSTNLYEFFSKPQNERNSKIYPGVPFPCHVACDVFSLVFSELPFFKKLPSLLNLIGLRDIENITFI